VVSDSDWISESIIFTFRIWFGYGVHEKASDWIRIAEFPYPYTIGSEIPRPSRVGIFHRSDSCLLTSLVDSRPPDLCAPFFTSCEAMDFAETGHGREESQDLPVALLMVLHALRLECEKSMELTASCYRSCFFCSSRDSRDEAALSESVPTAAQVKEQQRVSHSLSQHGT